MQAALAIRQGVETENTAGSAICNKLPDMTLIPTPERPHVRLQSAIMSSRYFSGFSRFDALSPLTQCLMIQGWF
jgi:hypothetical protein